MEAKAGASMTTEPGDKRIRQNKPGRQQSDATLEKGIDEGRRWAFSIYEESVRTTSAFLAGLAYA